MGDEQYMIGEDQHVNELKVYHIDELANLLDSVCNWRCVADKLGLSDDEKLAVEAGTGTVVDPKRPALRHVPTVDVLRLWRTKPRSTVRVLRQVLATVASDELVQQLDRRRMMLVTLSLVIKRDGRPGEFLSLTSPARKPLIDVIRPLLNRKLSQPSVNRGDRVVVRLDVTRAPDISWSSQAHHFVGQEWSITYSTLRLPVQISQTGPRCKDLRLFDAQSQRNAMTWADDETFIFDYTCDVAAATSVGEGAISTSPKFARPPCSDDDEEIVYENPAVDDCSRGTETTPAENDEPQPLIFSVSPLRDALRHAADMETQVVILPQSGGEVDSDI